MNKSTTKNTKTRKGKINGSARPIEAAAVAYSQMQQFPKRNNRSRRIQNSELIASITGSVSFDASQKFVLNPGISATFPWLSVMAAQWQQYRFHKLCFRYVTRTATAEKGSVILSPDYNPRESQPVTEQQASNTQDAVEDVCWKSLVCVLDPQAMFPIGPRKQVRTMNVAGDNSLYDAGRLFVAVVGEDSADEIGKLWVDYDVEFYVPQNSPSFATAPVSTSYYSIGSTEQTFTTSVATTVNFGTKVYDPLGVGDAVSGVFTPAAGCYLIRFSGAFYDNTDEIFTCTLDLEKNNVALSPIVRAISLGSAGTTVSSPFSLQAVVLASGSDTFRIRATLVGATGVLKSGAGCNLIWSLA